MLNGAPDDPLVKALWQWPDRDLARIAKSLRINFRCGRAELIIRLASSKYRDLVIGIASKPPWARFLTVQEMREMRVDGP